MYKHFSGILLIHGRMRILIVLNPHLTELVCEILLFILEHVVERAKGILRLRAATPKRGPDVTAGHPTRHITTYVLHQGKPTVIS